MATSGAATSLSEIIPAGPNTTWAAAGARPASSRARTITSTEPGVSCDGLQMMAHPAPRAPASFFAARAMGKFQGLKAATTPMGWVWTSMRLPGVRPATTRSLIRRACSPPHSRKSAERCTSMRAWARGLPCSRVMARAAASTSIRRMSAACFRTRPRAQGGVADHSRRPCAAAAMASSRSCADA